VREPLAEYPRTVVLKDGVHVVLAPMTPADAPAVGALAGAAATSADAVADAVIVARDGERVAGAAVLRRRDDAGVVDVLLAPAYRGRRLGTWMLLDLVHLAGALDVARLEARVGADDGAFRAALRRLDFVEEPAGTGTLVKTLHREWPDF
jgi:GNAT superfamily N-acetyltransferase